MSEEKTPKRRTLVSGAAFHDFEASPEFTGTYLTPVVREKDGDENQKAGDVMGYLFADENGEETIIGNSHQVGKAIEQVKKGDLLYFQFLGKTQNSKGQQVNRFRVELIEPGDEPVKKSKEKS